MLVLILLGLLGILIHVLFKFNDVVTKEPKNGRPFGERLRAVWSKFDLLGNLTYGLVAVAIVVLFVLLRDKLLTLGVPVTEVTIVFVGYAADSAFKNLSNLQN